MHEERNTKFAHSGEDGALRSLKPNDDFLQATYVRTSCTQVCGQGPVVPKYVDTEDSEASLVPKQF